MPMKINSVDMFTVQKRQNLIKEHEILKKDAVRNSNISYSANNVMKNSQFNTLQNLVFKLIDSISPIVQKHPKLGARLIKVSEKLLQKMHVAE